MTEPTGFQRMEQRAAEVAPPPPPPPEPAPPVPPEPAPEPYATDRARRRRAQLDPVLVGIAAVVGLLIIVIGAVVMSRPVNP